ncbi:GxxExxY protein [Pyramidobacter piscolens]|uniref:GxxExxY protein n=1 Tax=Pyramidobacter piscolens TaxID=638849 RepID=UPI0033324C89
MKSSTGYLPYINLRAPDFRSEFIRHDASLTSSNCDASKLKPVHTAQLLSYMKLTGKTLGYLINFNVPLIKDGIHRLFLPYSARLPRTIS